jgi:hypothetical protein
MGVKSSSRGPAATARAIERGKSVHDDAEWMNDEQRAIYRELRKICDGICDALNRKDQNAWTERTMRLREITRLAAQKMFARS